MFIGVFMLLIPIAVFVGIVLWVRRSQAGGAESTEQRVAGPEVTRTRISLLTEAIVYIGAILVLAGGGAAIRQQWHGFGDGTRFAILGSAALVFLAIGVFTRSSAEPALRRVTSVTWALSVAAFAGAAAVVNTMYGTQDEIAFLTIATTSTAYATTLWAVNQHAIQHAVMFAGVLASAAAIEVRLIHDPEPWIVASTIWAIAVAWVALGWTRRIPPWWMAVPLGLLVALFAPASMNVDAATFALGIGTAAAIMALSVVGRFTPGLALGAVGMLGYVVGAVTRYFGDTIGVPAALAITGVLILVLAAVVTRLFRLTTRDTRHADGGAEDVEPAGRTKAA